MGSPKALLELGGETFLDRLILVFGQVCEPVIVVLGHEPQRVRTGLRCADLAQLVWNPDYRQGQLTSLQHGLAEVSPESTGVLFTPVDYPAVLPSTVAQIVRLFRERKPNELLAIPRFGGRRGHPVCAARELIPEFMALPAEARARDVIHRHREQTVYADVDDPAILDDVDDPEAYLHLKSLERRL